MQRTWTIRYYFAGVVWQTHAMPRRSALALADTMRDHGLAPAVLPTAAAA